MLASDSNLTKRFLKGLTPVESLALLYDWGFWARPSQLPPPGDWTTWLFLGGRGAGKTRAGVEWIRANVEAGRMKRIAIVAHDAGDARRVMIEGESGILATASPWCQPIYEPSKRVIAWPNGAIATIYTDAEPDALRGPSHDGAFCDELAKWKYPQKTWDNLQLGLRLGERPRQIVTTTPRAIPILKQIMKRTDTVVTHDTSYANRANLAPAFFTEITRRYEGSRLGRQELQGEMLEDISGALFDRAKIDVSRVDAAPELSRVVVAVDPPISSDERADECGMIVAGKTTDEHAYVIADLSRGQQTPQQWASRAVEAYRMHGADCIVAEANQGGEMVRTVLRHEDSAVPVKLVHASTRIGTRASPVATVYEQGKVHHVGSHPELEDQLCMLTVDYDKAVSGSPDRADALIYAVTDLLTSRRPREIKVW